MARLARIDIFPIKSLDGLTLSRVEIAPGGALRGDRTYALFDDQHQLINGKRVAAIHQLRAAFQADGRTVTLSAPARAPQSFTLAAQNAALLDWLGQYLQRPVTLQTNTHIGFPDDLQATGPTVISTATLETVASWYPALSVEEVRRRFRTNLEIEGVPPFWEDQLFSAGGQPVPFRIGSVTLRGINPCQRCIVPTRDSATGEALPQFQQRFSQQRLATLPDWAPRQRFNHFYRLAVNTVIPAAAGQLQVGDEVILGEDS